MNQKLIKTFASLSMICTTYCMAVDISSIASSDINTKQTQEKVTSSSVFGAHLFTGNFKQFTQHIYNPEYKIAIGDQIALKVWGAVEFEKVLTVDSQGNVFVPKVGAINLLGSKNGDLVHIFKSSIGKVYRDNVFIYADMNTIKMCQYL